MAMPDHVAEQDPPVENEKKYLFHSLAAVKNFVKETGGERFRVWFVKEDGTLRKMKCHVDLKFKPKKLKAGEKRKKLPPTSVFVFDMKKEEYRSFRGDRVVYINM